ncbi:MAG: hypothetical protein H0X17_24510 [Deltaproteobacteria bacterium]|nr:hypothetical protein [Deltaproteobacteria bacterium]
MALLRTLALALLVAACYSPDVRDCTVSCAAVSDCAGGQVCGSDQFCAAPEVAGRCAQLTTDAGVDEPRPDARVPADAAVDAAPPDAAIPMVQLHIRIDGRGVVTVPNIGVCDAGSGAIDCMYAVPQGAPVSLHAVPKNHWRFGAWESTACSGEPETCLLTPVMPTFVKVRFQNVDDATN